MARRELAPELRFPRGMAGHVLNQSTLGNPDRSNSTYPILVAFLVLGFGLVPAVVLAQLVLFLAGISRHPPLPDLFAYVEMAVPGLFALWLALAWLVGLVPFDADRTERPRAHPLEPSRKGRRVFARVTGVFDSEGQTRRFRERPAVVEFDSDTQILVQVQPRSGEGVGKKSQYVPVAEARLWPETVRRVRRGTAYLVTETRPAIELHWVHGRVLLTFDVADDRDRVFSILSDW